MIYKRKNFSNAHLKIGVYTWLWNHWWNFSKTIKPFIFPCHWKFRGKVIPKFVRAKWSWKQMGGWSTWWSKPTAPTVLTSPWTPGFLPCSPNGLGALSLSCPLRWPEWALLVSQAIPHLSPPRGGGRPGVQMTAEAPFSVPCSTVQKTRARQSKMHSWFGF